MKKLIRLLALLLSFIMILPIIASCNDATHDQNDNNESTENNDIDVNEDSENTESQTTHDLPEIKWDGQIFNVLGWTVANLTQFDNFEITYDEDNLGESVNDAIFKRNSKIETLYDVKISQELVGDTTNAIKTTSVSGDHLYDLVFQPLFNIGTSALEGYFFDLTRIKYIDFTKPYWNPQVNDTISIADRVYFTSSDFSLRDKNRAYILFYNPTLAETHDVPDIISLVREGKWTIDLMTEYADRVDEDLTGEGTRSVYDDAYGLVADSSNAFATFMYGMGNMIIGRNEDNDMTLTMNNERTISSIDKVIKLFCDKNITYYCTSSDWSAGGKCWYPGRALFSAAFTHSLKTSTENCEFDFNIIPYPKYDEMQENYYTVADGNSMLFAIPTSCKNSEFSGFMIESLSAESTDTSLYAYYDIACKTRYSYNPVNGEMLDLIFEGIRFDVANIYSVGSLFNIYSSIIPASGQNLFSSLYKKRETNALNKIQEIKDILSGFEY